METDDLSFWSHSFHTECLSFRQVFAPPHNTECSLFGSSCQLGCLLMLSWVYHRYYWWNVFYWLFSSFVMGFSSFRLYFGCGSYLLRYRSFRSWKMSSMTRYVFRVQSLINYGRNFPWNFSGYFCYALLWIFCWIHWSDSVGSLVLTSYLWYFLYLSLVLTYFYIQVQWCFTSSVAFLESVLEWCYCCDLTLCAHFFFKMVYHNWWQKRWEHFYYEF